VISVVIRSKNERQYLGEVLRAVLAQDDPEEFEVVVIDSGSTDGTTELVRTLPVRLHEILPENFTFGYALNLGRKLAKGRIIVYLSAHSTPTTHYWLRELVEPLRCNPHLAATYGRQEARNGVNPFEESSLLSAFPPDSNYTPAALFSNANCAIQREVLEEHPFDEELEFAEDLVWCSHFETDLILYTPKASVYHTHPLVFRYWARRFRQDGAATVRMRHRYGIVNPYVGNFGGFKTAVRKFLGGCLHQFRFFRAKKYYKFIPLIAAFEAMRVFCFSSGVREGHRKLAKDS
jgi:glycosyltransferase involved in cell wall biosynthesis